MSAGRTALLVVGMHRSGTSATARLLDLFGAQLAADLIQASPDNARGYWESREAVELNDRLLADYGLHYLDACSLPDDWAEQPQATYHVGQIKRHVKEAYDDAPLLCIKDPRLCLALPAWLRAFEELSIDVRVLVVVRHPFEVAASLVRRDPDYAPQDGMLAWLRHVLDGERHSRGVRRAWVAFDDVLRKPDCVFDACTSLGLELQRSFDDVKAEVLEFLDPALRHHVAASASGPDYFADIYAEVRAAMADGSPQAWEAFHGRHDSWLTIAGQALGATKQLANNRASALVAAEAAASGALRRSESDKEQALAALDASDSDVKRIEDELRQAKERWGRERRRLRRQLQEQARAIEALERGWRGLPARGLVEVGRSVMKLASNARLRVTP